MFFHKLGIDFWKIIFFYKFRYKIRKKYFSVNLSKKLEKYIFK